MKLITMLAAAATVQACHDLNEMRRDFNNGKLMGLPSDWIKSFWDKCAPKECTWSHDQRTTMYHWRKDRDNRHIRDWEDFGRREFTKLWFEMDGCRKCKKRSYHKCDHGKKDDHDSDDDSKMETDMNIRLGDKNVKVRMDTKAGSYKLSIGAEKLAATAVSAFGIAMLM